MLSLNSAHVRLAALPSTPRMPVLFVGHGSPMNAVEHNEWTSAWSTLGASLPRPNAVLCVSAHWVTEGIGVHVAERPRTIHDFYGFPEALYGARYACPGAPGVAEAAVELLDSARADTEWGLDHGAWIPLQRMYPKADVPVFQVSLDAQRHHSEQYSIGEFLAPLRDRGVLIVGSGNIVHNLGRIAWKPGAPAYDWAEEFDRTVTGLISRGDHDALIHYKKMGTAAALSVPTPEHYWPLLTVLGASGAAGTEGAAEFPVTGLTMGSISMRSVVVR